MNSLFLLHLYILVWISFSVAQIIFDWDKDQQPTFFPRHLNVITKKRVYLIFTLRVNVVFQVLPPSSSTSKRATLNCPSCECDQYFILEICISYFVIYVVLCVMQHCLVHPWRLAGPVLRGLLEPSQLWLSAPASVLPSPPLHRLGPGAARPQPAGPLPPPTAVWAWSWWYEGRTGEGPQGLHSQLVGVETARFVFHMEKLKRDESCRLSFHTMSVHTL